MSRYDDTHYDCRRWSNRKLMYEARKYANFDTFGASMIARKPVTITDSDEATNFIVEETNLYRRTWLDPILDEIERRFVKS